MELGAARKPIAIALQGGGSYGAYTWGVLDALLERDVFSIEGVTGASSGAVNAALLADGFVRGGTEGARALLGEFWLNLAHACKGRRRSRLAGIGRITRSLLRGQSTRIIHEVAAHAMADFAMDPATMEPLRSTLDELLDAANVAAAPFSVFINATVVRSVELRVFTAEEICTDTLCASACVPLLFEPVIVDGEAYWDGGFLGNPALFPVIEACDTADLLLVQTTPSEQPIPASAGTLLTRMSHIGFAAALRRELRAIEFVSQIVRDATPPVRSHLREIRLHAIPTHPDLAKAENDSPFKAGREFFLDLHDLGRAAATEWLDANATRVGKQATFHPRSEVDLR